MRKILITGASGGIAQALVKQLPQDFLILLGRDGEKLEQLYRGHAQKAVYQVDISNGKALEELVGQIRLVHGDIDILINNAGYATYKDFEDFSAKEVEEMFSVNTFTTMTLCRLIGKEMKAVKKGQIINIVSMSGHIASAQSSVYSATKFALIGFSNTIRLELAPYNVAVTTINPGPVATNFFAQADPDGTYQEKVKAFTLQPEVVAKRIIRVMGTKKREVNLPLTLVFVHKFYSLFPNLTDFLARTIFNYK